MRRSKFAEEQVAMALRQGEAGRRWRTSAANWA